MVKRLRWGLIGEEKPGLVDYHENLRDLSGEIEDISGSALLNDNIKQLSKKILWKSSQ